MWPKATNVGEVSYIYISQTLAGGGGGGAPRVPLRSATALLLYNLRSAFDLNQMSNTKLELLSNKT